MRKNLAQASSPKKVTAKVLSVLLDTSLCILYFLPPLAFMYLSGPNGIVLCTAYREPKFWAVIISAWLFLSVFWVNTCFDGELHYRAKHGFKNPWILGFGVFLCYLLVTMINSLVIEASIYEWFQFFTMFALVHALSAIFGEKRRFKMALFSLCAAILVLTIIGFIQIFYSIPWLMPIWPETAVRYPSTMGYKNPAAHAVLGQWFLLFGLVIELFTCKRRFWGVMAASALLLEACYLVLLQSRTAYFAFAVGMALGAVLSVIAFKKGYVQRRSTLTFLGLCLGALIVAGMVFSVSPKAVKRLKMAIDYLEHPIRFMNSDRGTYLRNSVSMAKDNFFGVGLGNWGFAYPVYRRINPNMMFTEDVQVVKAHGDYAQILGETGWPGLILWLSLLTYLIVVKWPFRLNREGLILNSGIWLQVIVFTIIMMTDYCIQMPYHKWAFFGVIGMLISLEE